MPKREKLEFDLKLDHLSVLHNYNRLVRQGFVEPLTHNCGQEYTVRTFGDEFFLKCYACGTSTDPGLAELKAWQARIDDHEAKRA